MSTETIIYNAKIATNVFPSFVVTDALAVLARASLSRAGAHGR